MGISNYFSCDTDEEAEKPDNCNENEDKTSSKGYYWAQFIAGFSIYFLSINHGVHAAWTSPALPYLTNETSKIPITEEQGAWVASIPSFGIMLGTVISPLFLDLIGRKNTLFLSATPALLTWIIIIFSKDYITLYIARFISGIGSGMTYSAATLYFAEISSKNIRGILITSINVCSNLGTLFVVSIGAFFTYETMNIVMISLPILALMTLPLMLKTPYYLLMMNDEKRAQETLMKLRGNDQIHNVHSELERIKSSVIESRNIEQSSFWEIFASGNRKGLIMLLFATSAMYLSGVAAIEAYSEDIFGHSNFSINPKYSTIILGVVRIIAGLSSTLFIDRARKMMLLISGTLSSFALITVGFFYFLDSKSDFDASSITWIPLVGLISFLIFCNLGLVSIPAIFMGELFSINARGKAVAIGVIFSALFIFVTKFWFQELKNDFGMHMPFWIFAFCCLVSTFVVYCISPETSGKTLEEVQSILKQGKQKTIAVSENLQLDSISA